MTGKGLDPMAEAQFGAAMELLTMCSLWGSLANVVIGSTHTRDPQVHVPDSATGLGESAGIMGKGPLLDSTSFGKAGGKEVRRKQMWAPGPKAEKDIDGIGLIDRECGPVVQWAKGVII